MNLIGYTRVSTSEQGESGLGLEAQLAVIEAAVRGRGDHIVQWFDDVQSGGEFERPGLQEALAWLRPESLPGSADGLIVAKLDRLARSVVDFGLILQRAQKEGWSLIALDIGVDTATATGEMVANILMAVAQWERKIIGERTKAALAAKAARGEQVGRAAEVPPEVEDLIRILRRQGYTFETIRSVLERDCVPSARGGAWSTSTVSRAYSRACARHDLMEGSNDSDG